MSSNKQEKTITVSNDTLDKKEAQLEKQGYDVCGEKSLPRQRTEITYRPDPDKKASK